MTKELSEMEQETCLQIHESVQEIFIRYRATYTITASVALAILTESVQATYDLTNEQAQELEAALAKTLPKVVTDLLKGMNHGS